jgi:tetratricopeptide (TPR) repeat protein
LVQALNGVVLESTGRCEEAFDFYRSTLEAVPNNPLGLGGLVRVNYCLERYEETYRAAVANWEGRGNLDAVAALERGYAEGGFEGAMSALGEWKVENTPFGFAGSGAAFNFAAAGRNQEALDILERGFEEHDPNMPYLGVWGPYRSLRVEPRFQELLRRMNLPAS